MEWMRKRPKTSAVLALLGTYAAWSTYVGLDEKERRRRVFISARELGNQQAPLDFKPRRFTIFIDTRTRRARNMLETDVEPVLHLAGIDFGKTVVQAEENTKSDCSRLLLDKTDGVIVIGGDGLVHEVVTGLLRHKDAEKARRLPIGVVPGGGENTFFSSLVQGRQDVTAAEATLGMALNLRRLVDVLEITTVDPASCPPIAAAVEDEVQVVSEGDRTARQHLAVPNGKKIYAVTHLSAGLLANRALETRGFMRRHIRLERIAGRYLFGWRGAPVSAARIAYKPANVDAMAKEFQASPDLDPAISTNVPSPSQMGKKEPFTFKAPQWLWPTASTRPVAAPAVDLEASKASISFSEFENAHLARFSHLSITHGLGFSTRYPTHPGDHSTISQGYAHLVIVPELGRFGMFSLGRHLWKNEGLSAQPNVTTVPVTEVLMSVPHHPNGSNNHEPLLNVDGTIYPGASMHIKVLPRHMTFFVPAPTPSL